MLQRPQMNSNSQDRFEAPSDASTSEVGLPATNKEQNTEQSVKISQDVKIVKKCEIENLFLTCRNKILREPLVSDI